MGVKAEVMGEGGIADNHFAFWSRLAKPRHGVGQAFDEIRQQGPEPGAKSGQGCGKGGGLSGDIGVDLGPSRHSAAFIWKPSSILSEGATG